MNNMDAIKQTFFEECDEQLTMLEVGLLDMQEGNHDLDRVNEIFRAVHSIKGSAGAFSLETLVHFSHVFENTLDLIRSEKLEPSDSVIKVMLRATDVLFDVVAAAKTDREVSNSLWEPLAQELAAINETVADPEGEDNEEADDDEVMFEPLVIEIGGDADPLFDLSPIQREFVIKFAPRPELYETANEPLHILRELGLLGDATIVCDTSRTPLLDAMSVNDAFLSWTITLLTEDNEGAIRELFEFVENDCLLEIEETVSEDFADIDVSDLVAIAKGVEPDAQDSAVTEQNPVSLEVEKTDTEQKNVKTKSASPAASAASNTVSATVRVDIERIDKLINLVGELVITQSMLSLRASSSQAGNPEAGNSEAIKRGLDELEQLTREIQDSVMAIRAQPVKSLFQRMSRVTREAAVATGKQIALHVEGDATEVDKTVIERLADPLTHMIRNGADHGLESTEERLAAGKPEEGTITLSASHRSGRVIIEVSDDGAGINRPRVRKIAEDKGLISPDTQLSDNEIDNLIFMAGFSTVENVSSLSGRGVGMDVVKNAIHSLGGKVSISSTPGKGSTFSMSLPLTMAVLEGMIVSVKEQTFIIPLTAVIETLRLEEKDFHPLGSSAAVVSVRDKFVPVIDVGAELGLAAETDGQADGILIMIETEAGTPTALLVDKIQDQRQVVIKSLDANYGAVRNIAAATVLGDGRVALILDVEALVGRSNRPLLETEILLKKAG